MSVTTKQSCDCLHCRTAEIRRWILDPACHVLNSYVGLEPDDLSIAASVVTHELSTMTDVSPFLYAHLRIESSCSPYKLYEFVGFLLASRRNEVPSVPACLSDNEEVL